MSGPLSKGRIAVVSAVAAVAVSVAALAQSPSFSGFTPDNLVVSRSVYTGDASTVTVGEALPAVCPPTASCGTATATDNGAYPAVGSTNNVWNNNKVDGSFGVTSPIFLDQITPTGTLVNTLAVPGSLASTSFSSKSEVALNLSLDAKYVTFMAYQTPPNTVDVSNSNTPGAVDPTNPVGTSYYRSVVQVDAKGAFQLTNTNSYSGNNGRAAVLANGVYYMAGNSNNGSGTPANIIATAGVQLALPGQDPATPAVQIGNFSITQYNDPATGKPYAADKAGKDNNFRGLTIFNNTLYTTKGSGSNGINTVYQVGDAGSLPAPANAAATPITILPGLPTTLAKNADAANPFGIWFANATTLYVADEGDGTTANAATSTNAGLQKWILVNSTWQRAYVLQNGLNLGQQYSIANYPTSLDPATDGIRNITGRANGDGTVTVWGVTSTISANGDQGADPNKLVAITDVLANTTAAGAANEVFTTIRSAGYGEVLRGVSFTPGTTAPLAITSASPLPQGTAGAAYSQTLAASGGTPPYTWSVASGTLPSGLALSAAGVISGTPALAGASTFSIMVTDSASTAATATQAFSLTVAASACALSVGGQGFTAAGGNGTVNVTGGSACPAWTVSGAPSWVTVSGAGTGTGSGTVSYQVAANTGAARSAILIIAFNSYTVEQAAAAGVTTFTGTGTIAQIASAGTWQTTITLVNTGASPAQARLSFFDDSGKPLALPLSFPQSASSNGPTLASTLDRTVNPLSEVVIQSTGPDSQAPQTGWAQVLTAGALSGSVILRETSGSTALEAQAPIDFRADNAYFLPFDNTAGAATQVILANLSSAVGSSIGIVIRDDSGNLMQTGSLLGGTLPLIPPMGHTTFDLATNYPATKNRRGTVEFDSPGGIAVLGVRSTSVGGFSAITSLAK
ncbi:MAG TPA: Ig domain-containing protein [Bryobacteraceae bacterium]|nr:Ig domain-containing protein [Bryobacteraceae bacterium]